MPPKSNPFKIFRTGSERIDDLEAYRKKIEEAGGKIVVEKVEVPEVGIFSMFEDPDGRMLGIWKQKK